MRRSAGSRFRRRDDGSLHPMIGSGVRSARPILPACPSGPLSCRGYAQSTDRRARNYRSHYEEISSSHTRGGLHDCERGRRHVGASSRDKAIRKIKSITGRAASKELCPASHAPERGVAHRVEFYPDCLKLGPQRVELSVRGGKLRVQFLCGVAITLLSEFPACKDWGCVHASTSRRMETELPMD